jgi:HAD superfamily hydrolase (TIGR01459 family)
LAERFDGFILDLWGVIHDGVSAFPHAVRCLEHLQAAGKRTLLLSNVPRPNAAVEALMRRMGIAAELYTSLLTSGEAVRNALIDPPDLWWAQLGRRVWHLGPERDRPILDGLPLQRVDMPSQADFVLNTGPDDHSNPTDIRAFEPVLQDCARHHLPMVCANPDLEVIRGGIRVLCAGSLALKYRALGGDVRSLGKPDPAIYQPALRRLGVPPSKLLAVGDALRTDIAGAAAVDLPACWVLGGLHGTDLACPGGFDTARAEQEARDAGLNPLATVPLFAW